MTLSMHSRSCKKRTLQVLLLSSMSWWIPYSLKPTSYDEIFLATSQFRIRTCVKCAVGSFGRAIFPFSEMLNSSAKWHERCTRKLITMRIVRHVTVACLPTIFFCFGFYRVTSSKMQKRFTRIVSRFFYLTEANWIRHVPMIIQSSRKCPQVPKSQPRALMHAELQCDHRNRSYGKRNAISEHVKQAEAPMS